MKDDRELKKIRQRVYMTFFQDGLWDLVLGLFLTGWGFAVTFDLGWLPGAAFVGLFWITLGLKQKLTYPRTGYVKPAGQRKQTSRILITGIITLLLGLMIFVLVTTGETPEFLSTYFELFFGSMLAAVVVLIGYWWHVFRWYIYAALIFIFAAVNQWSEMTFAVSFFIPGGTIVAYGLLTLVRFLRNYPTVPLEKLNGNQE